MPDLWLPLTILEILFYAVICHTIGCTILLAMRLKVPGVIPPYPLLGSAALAVQLWAYGFAHIPWNALTLLLPWVVVGAIVRRQLAETVRRQISAGRSILRRLRRPDPVIGALVGISMLLLATYAASLFIHPAVTWDAVAFWLFKAKLFFIDQHVDPATSALASIPDLDINRNQEYPPLYSLMVASTWVLAGRIEEALGNAVNLLGLVSVVATLTSVLRPLLGIRLSVVMNFLFLALPAAMLYLVTGYYFGYADYVVACWIVLALLYVHVGARNPAADVMAVACAAGAALTKDEGTPLLVAVLAVLTISRLWQWRRQQQPLPAWRNVALAGVCVVPVIIWHFTWQLPGTITPRMLNPAPLSLLPDLPSRAATILDIVSRQATRQNTDFWVLVAIPVALVLLALNRFRTGAALTAVFLLQLLAYFAVYLFTPLDLRTHLWQSADRVLVQLAPAAILVFAVSVSPYIRHGVRREARPETTVRPAKVLALHGGPGTRVDSYMEAGQSQPSHGMIEV